MMGDQRAQYADSGHHSSQERRLLGLLLTIEREREGLDQGEPASAHLRVALRAPVRAPAVAHDPVLHRLAVLRDLLAPAHAEDGVRGVAPGEDLRVGRELLRGHLRVLEDGHDVRAVRVAPAAQTLSDRWVSESTANPQTENLEFQGFD